MEDREQIYQDAIQRYRETIRKGQKAYRNNVMKDALEDIKSGAIAVDEAMKIFDEIGLPALQLELPQIMNGELDSLEKQTKKKYRPSYSSSLTPLLFLFFGIHLEIMYVLFSAGSYSGARAKLLVVVTTLLGVSFVLSVVHSIVKRRNEKLKHEEETARSIKNLQLAIEAITKIIPYQKDPV